MHRRAPADVAAMLGQPAVGGFAADGVQLRQKAPVRLRLAAGAELGQLLFRVQLVQAQVQAPVLEQRGPAVGGHADADASYEFRCAEPAKLRQVEQRLFEHFRRLERLQVQLVGPRGQRQLTLQRPARTVPLMP